MTPRTEPSIWRGRRCVAEVLGVVPDETICVVSEQPYPEGKVSWRPFWSVLVVCAVFVGFGVVWSKPWSSGPGGPTDAACHMFPADSLSQAVGTPLRVLSGFRPDSGPAAARGCTYASSGQAPVSLEVWVLTVNAAVDYKQGLAVNNPNEAAEGFKDVSGPGFLANQTFDRTEILKDGVEVTVDLMPSSPQTTATFPPSQGPLLLTRLRQAVLARLK